MNIVRHIAVGAGLAAAATPALAGFNEGDSFGPSTSELLALGALGLIALPVGALLTFSGLERLFRAVFWFLAFCLALLVVAGAMLAGQLVAILVLIAGVVAIPAVAFFYLGGLLGRIARRKRTKVAA
ncbi:hypothetical protein [uncultured Tateyamaria sp.]|uniref:hypothetical protein n=1 Tax=Tateyamaria sp. 1078 TaxID=3417464 RepID=UPI0026322AC8|nr:hypothetical protein [uncultured Tateyamaria sp.]